MLPLKYTEKKDTRVQSLSLELKNHFGSFILRFGPGYELKTPV